MAMVAMTLPMAIYKRLDGGQIRTAFGVVPQQKIGADGRPDDGTQGVECLGKIDALVAGTLVAEGGYKGVGYRFEGGQDHSPE